MPYASCSSDFDSVKFDSDQNVILFRYQDNLVFHLQLSQIWGNPLPVLGQLRFAVEEAIKFNLEVSSGKPETP